MKYLNKSKLIDILRKSKATRVRFKSVRNVDSYISKKVINDPLLQEIKVGRGICALDNDNELIFVSEDSMRLLNDSGVNSLNAGRHVDIDFNGINVEAETGMFRNFKGEVSIGSEFKVERNVTYMFENSEISRLTIENAASEFVVADGIASLAKIDVFILKGLNIHEIQMTKGLEWSNIRDTIIIEDCIMNIKNSINALYFTTINRLDILRSKISFRETTDKVISKCWIDTLNIEDCDIQTNENDHWSFRKDAASPKINKLILNNVRISRKELIKWFNHFMIDSFETDMDWAKQEWDIVQERKCKGEV